MGWEKRHGIEYFYSKKRTAIGPVSIYHGRGATARLLASAFAHQQSVRQQQSANFRDEKSRQSSFRDGTQQLEDIISKILIQVLTEHNIHKQKGVWRKRRI